MQYSIIIISVVVVMSLYAVIKGKLNDGVNAAETVYELKEKYDNVKLKYDNFILQHQEEIDNVKLEYNSFMLQHQEEIDKIKDLNRASENKVKVLEKKVVTVQNKLKDVQSKYKHLEAEDRTLKTTYNELIHKEKEVRKAIFSKEIKK